MNGLKTRALLEGMAAIKRFAESVPQNQSVSVLEIVGKGKGKKVFYGHPIAEIVRIPSGESKKVQVKVLRKGSRDGTTYLKKRGNKGVGGNPGAVCEFVMVKRVRGAKGKAIGVIQKCFVDSSGIKTQPQQAPKSSMPSVMPDYNWPE